MEGCSPHKVWRGSSSSSVYTLIGDLQDYALLSPLIGRNRARAQVLACGPRRFHERGAAAVGSGNRPPAGLSRGLGVVLGLGSVGLGRVGHVCFLWFFG